MIDATNTNTALASAIVQELERSGARRAFISPGSRSTPLALALWRTAAIESSVVLDERSAAFAALGASQALGRPAIVVCTSGSAAANLHPAVVEANEAGVGLLLITADRPPELRGVGAGQTIDQLKLFGDAVRWFCELGTPAADDDGLIHVRSVACRAYARAAGDPRPGPVHINAAWREPLAPTSAPGAVTAVRERALDGRGEQPLVRFERARKTPPPGALDDVAEAIAGSGRALLIAGRRARTGAEKAITELAETARMPLLAEPTSQLRGGGGGAGAVIAAYDAIAAAAPEALKPEIVVRFGDMPTSKALRSWIGSDDEVRQIVVDPGHGFNEPTLTAERVVRFDEADAARALCDAIGSAPPSTSFLEAWAAAERSAQEAIDSTLGGGDSLASEPAAHRALGSLLEPGSFVYTASSMPIREQEAFSASAPNDVTYLCNRGANGIDGLVSSAAGAAIAAGAPTWVLVGDLGLDHDLAGLALISRAPGPVRVVVLNNGGGGIFEHLPISGAVPRDEFEQLFATPQGRSLAAAAAWAGLPHLAVGKVSELEAASRRTAVIEIAVDRGADPDLRSRLLAAVAGAVTS